MRDLKEKYKNKTFKRLYQNVKSKLCLQQLLNKNTYDAVTSKNIVVLSTNIFKKYTALFIVFKKMINTFTSKFLITMLLLFIKNKKLCF